MSKISIVGVEGSGKTTLMAAFGEKYERPDRYGYGLKAANARTFDVVKLLTARMRKGQWPSATEAGTVTNLDWTLYRREGASRKDICSVSFLDFAGEVYRKAFGEREAGVNQKQVEALRNHIKESDALVVLINLKDVINGDLTDERTREMLWISQGIIEHAVDTCKIKRVALAFSQFGVYREAVEAVGGLKGAYAKYLPNVEAIYPDLQLLAISAVDKTVVDAEGREIPAPDFTSTGLEKLMEWIISSVPGLAEEFADRRELPQKLWKALTDARTAYASGQWRAIKKAEPKFRQFAKLSLRGVVESGVAADARSEMLGFYEQSLGNERYIASLLELANQGAYDEALEGIERLPSMGISTSRSATLKAKIEDIREREIAKIEAEAEFKKTCERKCFYVKHGGGVLGALIGFPFAAWFSFSVIEGPLLQLICFIGFIVVGIRLDSWWQRLIEKKYREKYECEFSLPLRLSSRSRRTKTVSPTLPPVNFVDEEDRTKCSVTAAYRNIPTFLPDDGGGIAEKREQTLYCHITPEEVDERICSLEDYGVNFKGTSGMSVGCFFPLSAV